MHCFCRCLIPVWTLREFARFVSLASLLVCSWSMAMQVGRQPSRYHVFALILLASALSFPLSPLFNSSSPPPTLLFFLCPPPFIGNGKTHYIQQQLADSSNSRTIAVNEAFTPRNAISKLRTLPLKQKNCAIFFNFTILLSGVRVWGREISWIYSCDLLQCSCGLHLSDT